MTEDLVLAADGSIDGKKCVDCGEYKPLDAFQSTPKGGKARDCKACRRAKYEKGIQNKQEVQVPATKAWIIQEAKKLYLRADRDTDKAKYLDLISRNLNEEKVSATDDAKVIRDLIASKKKMKELGR